MSSLQSIAPLALMGCLLVLPASGVVTVDYNAGLGERNVTTAVGLPLPDGNEVRLGFFAPSFDVAANAGDLLALQGAWTQYDSTPVMTIFGEPGRFAASASELSNPSFDGMRIHLWIFETSDGAVPDGSFSNVLDWGLFTNLSDPAWTFPEQGVGTNTLVSSGQVTTSYRGLISAGSLSIPEPSLVWMLAFGVAVFFWRRRDS